MTLPESQKHAGKFRRKGAFTESIREIAAAAHLWRSDGTAMARGLWPPLQGEDHFLAYQYAKLHENVFGRRKGVVLW
jgi:hypothetical protein